MMTAPEIRSRSTRCRLNDSPTAVATSPSETKTTAKPLKNKTVSRTTLASWAFDGADWSAMSRPAIVDRYDGTTGSTHGETNEMTPPPNATTNPTSLTDRAPVHSSPSLPDDRRHGVR